MQRRKDSWVHNTAKLRTELINYLGRSLCWLKKTSGSAGCRLDAELNRSSQAAELQPTSVSVQIPSNSRGIVKPCKIASFYHAALRNAMAATMEGEFHPG